MLKAKNVLNLMGFVLILMTFILLILTLFESYRLLLPASESGLTDFLRELEFLKTIYLSIWGIGFLITGTMCLIKAYSI